MAQGHNTELEAHADALVRALLDDVAHQEGQDALGLVVLDDLGDSSRILGLAQDNGHAGDIAGDQGNAQGADDGIGHEADAGVGLIGIAALNILEAFDNFRADGGGQSGVQRLAQVLLVGDEALQHTDAGGQIAQGLDLDAGCGIDRGEEVGRVREGHGLVCSVLGNGVVDRLFGQTGNRIGATVDQIG